MKSGKWEAVERVKPQLCRRDASNTSGEWKPVRLELGICDICAIGEHRAREYAAGRGTRWLIANGEMLSPEAPVPLGAPDPQPNRPSHWKGCSGARFDFQRDGEPPQTTYSMWCGGHVGERQRDRMPNNGRILTREESNEFLASARPDAQTPPPSGDPS